MRWSSETRATLAPAVAGWLFGAGLLLVWLFLMPQQPIAQSQPERKQLTVYAAQTSYTLPVVSREGRDYIGLLEVLEPLGTVSAKLDRNVWKLRFDDREAHFTVGDSRARVHKSEVALGARFIAENGRGLVPLHVLPQILIALLPGRAIAFHEQARRLFLDRSEVRYSAEIRKGATGRLVLTFSAPVNPSIATEPGKLRMLFRHEPLAPNVPAGTLMFDDKSITSLVYAENNGAAELTVNSPAPLMASFSPDRKTITVAPLAPPPPQPAPVQPPSETTAAMAGGAGAGTAPVVPPPRAFLVVLDAAHGGDDPGGTITKKLAEKDVALTFARRLHYELQARGISSRLLRDGDTSLPLDQRIEMANAAVPSLYLAVHAAGSGTGIHMFTSRIPAAPEPRAFLDWDSAQAAYVDTSRAVATAIATELLKRDIPALDLSAPFAALNSIAAPALAIEVSAPVKGGIDDLNSPQYQQSVCSAIVTAVAAVRTRLPHGEAAR